MQKSSCEEKESPKLSSEAKLATYNVSYPIGTISIANNHEKKLYQSSSKTFDDFRIGKKFDETVKKQRNNSSYFSTHKAYHCEECFFGCLNISCSSLILISIRKILFLLLVISFLSIISYVRCNSDENQGTQPPDAHHYSSWPNITRSSLTGNNVDNDTNLNFSSPSSSSISIVTLAPTIGGDDNGDDGTIVGNRSGQSPSSSSSSTTATSVNKSAKKSKSSSSSMPNRKNNTATISVNVVKRKFSENNNNNNNGNNGQHNRHHRHHRNGHKLHNQLPDVRIQTNLHITDPEKTCLIGDACGGPNVGQSKRRGGGTGGYCYRPHMPINFTMDNDETESFYELLTENCPHFFDENDEPLYPLCCTLEMEDTMAKLIMSVDLIRRSCPSCLTNVKRLFCNLFCAPNQRDFIRVDRVKGNTVMEVTYAMSEMFVENFFQSCQDVQVFGSYLMDFESACGKLKRVNCTAMDFLHALGSLQEIPFRFRPLVISKQLESKIIELDLNRWPRHIMNDTSYRCDEAPPNQSTCRCEHCSEMCLLSNYNPHKPVNAHQNRNRIKDGKLVPNSEFDGGQNDLDSTETSVQKQRDSNYRINVRHVGKKKVPRSHQPSLRSSSLDLLPNIILEMAFIKIAIYYYLN